MQHSITHAPVFFMKNSDFWTDFSRFAFKLPPGASPTYDEQKENFDDKPTTKEKIRNELINSLTEPVVQTMEIAYKQDMVNESLDKIPQTRRLPPDSPYIEGIALPNTHKASLIRNTDGSYCLETAYGVACRTIDPIDPNGHHDLRIPGEIIHRFSIDSSRKQIDFQKTISSNSVLKKLTDHGTLDLSPEALKESIKNANSEEKGKRKEDLRYFIDLLSAQSRPDEITPAHVARALKELYIDTMESIKVKPAEKEATLKRSTAILQGLVKMTPMPENDAHKSAFENFSKQFEGDDSQTLFENASIYAQHILSIKRDFRNPLQEFIELCQKPETTYEDLLYHAAHTYKTIEHYISDATGKTAVVGDDLTLAMTIFINSYHLEDSNISTLKENLKKISLMLDEKLLKIQANPVRTETETEYQAAIKIKEDLYKLTSVFTSIHFRFDLASILPDPDAIKKMKPQEKINLSRQISIYMRDYLQSDTTPNPSRSLEEILIRELTKKSFISEIHYNKNYCTDLSNLLLDTTQETSVLSLLSPVLQHINLEKPIKSVKNDIARKTNSLIKNTENLKEKLIQKIKGKTANQYRLYGGHKTSNPDDPNKYPKIASEMLNILYTNAPNWFTQLNDYLKPMQFTIENKPMLRLDSVHNFYNELKTSMITDLNKIITDESQLTQLKTLETSKPTQSEILNLELKKMRARHAIENNPSLSAYTARNRTSSQGATAASNPSDSLSRSPRLSSSSDGLMSIASSATPFRNSPASTEPPNSPSPRGHSRSF